MSDESNKYLTDKLSSILSIENYIGEKKNFNIYAANKMLRRAVERELEIIGEAVSKLKKIDAEVQLTNSRKIIDLRNKVIHSYDSVDDIIIWGIVIKYLPILKTEIEAFLKF